MDSCAFCYQEEGPPKAPIVAIGHRAYLSCTQNEELVDGHCIIVPIQHYTSTLDLDDDEWEEIKVSLALDRGYSLALLIAMVTAEFHEVLDADVC